LNYERALAAMKPQVRDAFLAAVADLRSNAQIALVARAIEEGRIEDALRILNVDPVFFAPLDDAIRAAYLLGGRDAIAALPVIPDPASLGKWLSALTGETVERRNGSEIAPEG
jgi:hypothetical protein